MSSAISAEWRLAHERERQRQIALRAELEALRARERALRELRERAEREEHRRATALRAELDQLRAVGQSLERDVVDYQVPVSVPTVHHPGDASADDLEVVLKTIRDSLDSAEEHLQAGLRRQAVRVLVNKPTTSEASRVLYVAADSDDTAAEARRVGQITAAADELLSTLGPRCAEADLADLKRRRDALTHLGPSAARVALSDLELRLSESIKQRKQAEMSEQLRARLLYLAGEVPVDQSAGLRRAVADAPNTALPGLVSAVEAAVDRESKRRGRIEVARIATSALEQSGYAVGARFVDVLHGDSEVILLASDNDPYGVRLSIDPNRDRLHMTIVRRDDAVLESGPEALEIRKARELEIASDLDGMATKLAAGGCELQQPTCLREPDGMAPSMAAEHWPGYQPAEKRTTEETVEEDEIAIGQRGLLALEAQPGDST
jgi:hypothetical protein